MSGASTTGVIATYSPNLCWGEQIVEITLKQWDYAKTFTVRVGGNCRGFDVIECAAGLLADQIDPEAEDPMVELVDTKGETLSSTYSDSEASSVEAWINAMIVSIRIVGWDAPTLNEVRAMNGGAPVPDGDRPWVPL